MASERDSDRAFNRSIPRAIREFNWLNVPIEVQQEALDVAVGLMRVQEPRVKSQAIRTIVAFAQLGERAESQAMRLGLEAERLGLEKAKFEAELAYLAELERLKAIVEGRVQPSTPARITEAAGTSDTPSASESSPPGTDTAG